MVKKNKFMHTRVRPIQIGNNRNDDQYRRGYQRQEAAFYKCCSCCSCCSWVTALGIFTVLAIVGIAACLVSVLILRMPAMTSASTNDTSTITMALNSTSANTTTVTVAISNTTGTTSIVTTTSSTITNTTGTTSVVTTTSSTTTTTTAPYCLTHVTFDNIPNASPVSGVIPNGYNNLNWTNAEYVNSSAMPLSGYPTVVFYSGPYVADSPTAAMLTVVSANGTTFSFDSVVVSSVWREGLSWTITTYQGATPFISGSFSLSTVNRTTVSCGVCTGLTGITFTTSGGTPRTGLVQNGTQFAMDDLCISFGY